MAFLCPSRVGRNTKAKSRKKDKPFSGVPGRITGSDSIDTLLRVGLEKENGLSPKSKIRIIEDFQPCADEEVAVKRGEEVYLLYKENDWGYIIKRNGEEGFIPFCYCTRLFGPESISSEISSWRETNRYSFDRDSLVSDEFAMDLKKNTPRKESPGNKSPPLKKGIITREEMMRILQTPPANTEEMVKPEVRPFRKTSHGQFIVLFDFLALDENDITVERAELVDVLNIEDPDWSWIKRYDGREGFVPKSYICPVEPLKAIERAANGGHSRQSSVSDRLPRCSSSGRSSKPPKKVADSSRLGHPYLSQPALNMTEKQIKRHSRDTNMKLSKTFLSSDAINQEHNGKLQFLNNNKSNHSESMYTIPTKSFVVPIVTPPRSASQTITLNDEQLNKQSSTFKLTRKHSVTNSDFDDPECASSLPGTPRADPSQHTVIDSKAANTGSQTDFSQYLKQKQSDEGVVVESENETKVDNITECILLYDYTARSQDDLTVHRGDTVYDDGRGCHNKHWAWVFSPKTKTYGYVPRQYVKPLVQTSL